MDLIQEFQLINERYFDGLLALPQLNWNTRLRTTAGRFTPGSRRAYRGRYTEPCIEIAHYLLTEENSKALVVDTLAHEMIHYWLWSRGLPYGHTSEFYRKMKEMGVSRYNEVPRLRAPKYIYACPSCEQEYPARRRLKSYACLKCCKKHNQGEFHRRFVLVIKHELVEPVGRRS